MRLSPTRAFVAEAGCYWPFRRDVNPPPDKENAAMRRGKAIHSDIETSIKAAVTPRTPEGAHAIEWVRDRGGPPLSEKTFGVDPITGKVYEAGDKDQVSPIHIPIVVDLIIGNRETWDFKTGSPFSTFSYEPQVRLTAYAVAKWASVDEIVTGLAYVSASGVSTKSWQIDAFDLAEQKHKLRMWSEAAPNAKPNPGPVCKWCPARSVCPEAKAA